MINEKENKIYSLLCSLGICSPGSVEEFYPRVRDRDDIKVMRCQRSGVIFLSTTQHFHETYYIHQSGLSYWSASTREQALLASSEDDQRRAAQFGTFIKNKKWLDFGTGVGGILDLLSPQAKMTYAVEPQNEIRELLVKEGYRVFKDIDAVQETDFEIVTLFHVYEHLVEPIEMLKTIWQKMVPGGKLIPHAKDFLIDFLAVEAFKKFTFWSEHLILHTRQSLDCFLSFSGFKVIHIQAFQRYPLANHLYWLSTGQPGGHQHWHFLQTEELDFAYANMLARLDKTDTLIALAQK